MLSQSFSPVSPQKWEDIKAAFAKQGIVIDQDAGSGNHEGVKFSWAYGGNALAVDIISTSLLDDMAGDNAQAVMDKFSAWIASVD